MPADASPKLKDALRFLERVSCYYRTLHLEPAWNRHPSHRENPWDALALFLDYYAFERAGRSPEFSAVASDVVKAAEQRGASADPLKAAEVIWIEFRERLGSRGANPKVNPLYPSSDPDSLGLRATPSVTELQLPDGVTPCARSLTTGCVEMLQEDKVREAFTLLTRIRGIGPKIAPFFLRDVADWAETEPPTDRHLLQPVDTWVRRTTALLAGNALSDEDTARWIVDRSRQVAVSPERVNMGMWIFAAQIVRSEYRLRKALTDLTEAVGWEAEFRASLQRAAETCRNPE